MKTEITVGSRVIACGSLLGEVVTIKGRWIKIRLAGGTEKNVGFKDVTLAPANRAARNSNVTPGTACPKCNSHEVYHGRNVKGLVQDEDTIWGCHACGWSNIPQNGLIDGSARRRYSTTKVGDVVCVDNGDPVAVALRGMDIDDLFKVAADVLQTTQKELHSKYDHLNAGMQRMNLSNRLRKVVRADATNLKYIK